MKTTVRFVIVGLVIGISRRITVIEAMSLNAFLKKAATLANAVEVMKTWPPGASIHRGPTIDFRDTNGKLTVERIDVMDIAAYPKPIDEFLLLFRQDYFQSLKSVGAEKK